MITTNAAKTMIDTAKADGVNVTVLLTDGTTATGEPISVNSKGINIKVDGKTKSFSLTRVEGIRRNDSTEGLSTSDLAEMFEISAKELRVHLRSLGMGVGKGQRYSLTDQDIQKVRDRLATADA
jgi:hypothetical protein